MVSLPTPGIFLFTLRNLPPNNLAVLHPKAGSQIGKIELALCKQWGITAVLARQSGGPTQKIWQDIAKEQNLKLLLLSRPPSPKDVSVFNTYEELFSYL